MCGIIGYVGHQQAAPILLDGLARMEYRGYDSAGVAVRSETKGLQVYKSKGRLQVLSDMIHGGADVEGTLGIGHTRWATHGEPNDINAHPHVSEDGRIAMVHNGIIENYMEIKQQLLRHGVTFKSETDTEVAAQLLEFHYNECHNMLEAVGRVLRRIEGSYAFGIICADYPNALIAARKDSPLIIGCGENENFIASDVTAVISHTRDVIYMEDGEIAVLTAEGVNLFNDEMDPIDKPHSHIDWDVSAAEKGGYPHFMLKEIFEQPRTIRDCVRGRIGNSGSRVTLSGVIEHADVFRRAKRIIIVACGTSWHAGLIGKRLIEEYARIPVVVEYASEFRYSNPIVTPDDVVIAISQSGETADTLAAIKLAKERGAFVYGVCNVVGSSIARATDSGTYIHVGPEIGVASTKAFTGQVTVLTMFALAVGQVRDTLDREVAAKVVCSIRKLPELIKQTLKLNDKIEKLSDTYTYVHNFLYLGRGYNFPSALEGALKLKEISYIHAEGYPAAEMKHGPIALIDHELPTVVIAPKDDLHEKIISNIQQVKARGGSVIAVVTKGDTTIAEIADHIIEIPDVPESISPVIVSIPLQLLAYHIAVKKGCNVDMPRNLAKSVTVE